jgi:hypothetical protein
MFDFLKNVDDSLAFILFLILILLLLGVMY